MGITTVLIAITSILVYCFLGKLAAESYAKISDECLFIMKWYRQPIEWQKCYILVTLNMQMPVFYQAFGVIYLNLETFTKVSV